MAVLAGESVRLFVVDDSGVDATGWAIFGWLSFPLSSWPRVLEHRLRWRKKLYADQAVRIPASFHLHTGEFLGARGASAAPSENRDWNVGRRKVTRQRRVSVLEQALENLRTCVDLEVGVAYRHTDARNRGFGKAKADVYRQLVAHFDDELQAAGEIGLLVLDGDGSDISYIDGHRALSLRGRHLLEDPLYQRSHGSQLIQMADLIAFSGYQALLQDPEKSFAWDWFPGYLSAHGRGHGFLECPPALDANT